MSCSKIFLGDLPELTNEIIQYFREDYLSLHSCILVNRLWCRLAIPLLWENPFSIPTTNYHFIEIYLHNLNENDKTKLNEYNINDNLFPSSTLFNYPSFIKYVDTYRIMSKVNAWISDSMTSLTAYNKCFRLINKALFKTFIENEACLHALTISDLSNLSYFNDVLELILQNPNFIHNVKSLKLDISTINASNDEILNKIITLLSSNCNLISTLDSRFSFSHHSSQIIKSQQNLKKITFFLDYSLYHSLLSLKNSNCSNTLKTIIFSRIDFRNIVILSEVFEQLNVLESVHLLNCRSLDFHFVKQIINITKPFKLKSLLMTDGTFQVGSFQLLLQKSGNYLENIGLSLQTSGQSQQQLFELITKYCTNIKFFDLIGPIEASTYPAFDFIKNIGQNLIYLSIKEYSGKISSIVLQNLGQILPPKLKYVGLTLSIITSDFEVFLKNSQNTLINTLLIHRMCKSVVDVVDGGEDILPFIEKYIMKSERVKYLAFRVSDFFGLEDDWDLFYLKDVVKKFKLYNIEVQDYYDLYIDYPQHKKNNIFLDFFQ